MKRLSYIIFILVSFLSLVINVKAAETCGSGYDLVCRYGGVAFDKKDKTEYSYKLEIKYSSSKSKKWCIQYDLQDKKKAYYYNDVASEVSDSGYYARFSNSAVSYLKEKKSCPDNAYFETHYKNSWCFDMTSDKGYCLGKDKWHTKIPSKTFDKYNKNTVSEESGNSVQEAKEFNFCERKGVLTTLQIVGYIIYIIKVLIPVILIIMGSIDFSKAILASDDKAVKDAGTALAMRIGAGVIIFFIPTIINFVFGIIQSWANVATEFINCNTCVFKPNDCDSLINAITDEDSY